MSEYNFEPTTNYINLQVFITKMVWQNLLRNTKFTAEINLDDLVVTMLMNISDNRALHGRWDAMETKDFLKASTPQLVFC